KIPALPGLTIGSILGAICSVVVQKVPVGEAINILYYGFSIDTGNEVVDNLLNNGGIESVMFTISLIIIAMCFGGILEFKNIFEVLVEQIIKFARKTGSLVAATVVTCISSNKIGRAACRERVYDEL